MGIEPTGRTVNVRPNGFEDRGHHQVCKHFRSEKKGRRVCDKVGVLVIYTFFYTRYTTPPLECQRIIDRCCEHLSAHRTCLH